MSILKTEPSLVTGALAAVIALLVAFGVPLTVEQKAAVLGVVAPCLALVQAIVTRQQVVPVAVADEAVQDALYSEPPPAL